MSKTPSHPQADTRHGALLRELGPYRDLLVLKWLGEQYAGRIDHLETLTRRRSATTRLLVSRLRGAGLVRTRQILVGEPTWVIPTRAGLNACGLTFCALSTNAMYLAHVAAMNDVRLHVQGSSPETRWVSERQLNSVRERRRYVPDGLAIREAHATAIEVELSTKPLHKVYAKLNTFENGFDAVVYFCAPKPHRQLTAIQATGRWPRLDVRELPNREERP